MVVLQSRRGILIATASAVASLSLGTAVAFDAKSTAPINLDKSGIAIRGYDPVAYFTAGKPMKGDPAFQSTWNGATYNFVSAGSKAEFDKEPAKFAPQYGGFCAWATANGYKADADPNAWHVVGGKLYVNYNASVAKSWAADKTKLIENGDKNWPKVSTQVPN